MSAVYLSWVDWMFPVIRLSHCGRLICARRQCHRFDRVRVLFCAGTVVSISLIKIINAANSRIFGIANVITLIQ